MYTSDAGSSCQLRIMCSTDSWQCQFSVTSQLSAYLLLYSCCLAVAMRQLIRLIMLGAE